MWHLIIVYLQLNIIYFVFKLGEPALLGSKKIAYEYENFEISLVYEKWN